MILIAACSEYPQPTPSIAALLDALRSLGADVAYRPWRTTPLSTFAAAHAVLPLCCWDYHGDPAAFPAWIDALEARGARLLNPPATLRWNFRKTYLLQMAAAGLAVPPTIHLQEATTAGIVRQMKTQGWRTAVLKPVSGQSGYGVQKIDETADFDLSLGSGPSGEALLQDFQADMAALGETTLTFIDGGFSHAVRRVLKEGEWRANSQFGVTYERVDVGPDVIESAKACLALAPEAPVYARVDGIVRPSGFMLMELELIEPYLYLEFAPGSAERMARAVLNRVNGPGAA
ncbi:RimK family alpha-L-glutamate ligase [Microvirga sp. TS319]|uniref:ATP-grasp domain-containing protein n=1 Tax=Microvirga sp. TS319 TaxID=3241165 RepID=UPI00351A45C7